MEKCGNRTFSLFSGKVDFPLKSDISRNVDFHGKWPPEPIKTLGNTWYFRHGRKVDFLCEKLNSKLKMWNLQRNRKILRIFSIFCEFSNYAKPAGAGKVRFLRFHQKSENFTKMTKILEIPWKLCTFGKKCNFSAHVENTKYYQAFL